MKSTYKICLSAFILCLFAQNALAQWRIGETVDNAYTTISISAGIAAPEGQYSGRPNFERAGFAKLGTAIQFDVNYAMFGNIGITGGLAYIKNPIDGQLFFDQRIKSLWNSDFVEGSIDANTWTHYVVSAGPSLSFPEQLAVLELKLMLGGIYSLAGTIDYGELNRSYNFQRNSSFSFGADLRAGVHFRIAEPFRITGELRYFASAPNYDYTINYADLQVSSFETFQRQQQLNFFTFTVGVAWEL